MFLPLPVSTLLPVYAASGFAPLPVFVPLPVLRHFRFYATSGFAPLLIFGSVFLSYYVFFLSRPMLIANRKLLKFC